MYLEKGVQVLSNVSITLTNICGSGIVPDLRMGTVFGSCYLGQHSSDCTLDLDASIRIRTKGYKPAVVTADSK